MYKLNQWTKNDSYYSSKIAGSYFGAKKTMIRTACGEVSTACSEEKLSTACGEISTACGEEKLSTACGEINTACGTDLK